MTDEEYNSWKQLQMTNAGHWTVDPIHNGTNDQDLLVYVAQPNDPTKGIYVNIDNQKLIAGHFDDAIPHMGEASFTVKTRIPVKSIDEGMKIAVERLGLEFLLALTHNVSPYKSL